MRKLLVLILAALSMMSCDRFATSDAEQVKLAAQATLTAPIVEAPVPATAALLPTQTPIPTITPELPTPIVPPPGWTTYKMIGGPLIVAYPPGWEVGNEGVQEVVFSRADLPSVILDVLITKPEFNPGFTYDDFVSTHDAQMNFLKQIVIAANPLGGGVKFIDEGMLPGTAGQAYVLSEHRGGVRDGRMLATVSHSEGQDAFALILAIQMDDADMPDEVFQTVSQVARFIQWKTISVTPPPDLEPQVSPGSDDTLTQAEKAAISAVQEYTLDGSNTVANWLIVAMTAKKGMGDNIDLTGAYWTARENGQSTQVRFFYKEDSEWQYAEWRYVPSTGLVVGENEMGRLTVR